MPLKIQKDWMSVTSLFAVCNSLRRLCWLVCAKACIASIRKLLFSCLLEKVFFSPLASYCSLSVMTTGIFSSGWAVLAALRSSEVILFCP